MLTTLRHVYALFISCVFADQSLKIFCNRPPNFGTGTYSERDNKCTLTYKVISQSSYRAAEFCSLQHPYTPGQFSYDKETTTCDIYGLLECDVQEQLIGETCFLYNVEAQHDASSSLCKKISKDYTYDLHKVTSRFEQKWISTFFSNFGLMWVGNTNEELENLDVIQFEGKILAGRQGNLVPHKGSISSYVIVTRKGSMAKIRAGYIAPMMPDSYIPILCSRPATPKKAYLSGLMSKYSEAGIHSTNFLDPSNSLRAFSILRGLHAFEIKKDEFDAGTARLHKACSGFKHGYAATPFDFQNVNDFKKLLKDANVNIVAVPGRRTTKAENYDSCTERDPSFETARKTFVFDRIAPDGSTYTRLATNDSFWRSAFPDRTCGDMPRTAMAFTQEGLIDVPNIARLFVACTFGVAPKREGRPDEKCSLAGKLIENDKCECNDPDLDITVQKAVKRYAGDDKHLPGTLCVDCSGNRQYALAIILDQSEKAGRENVRFVNEFMKFSLAYLQVSLRLFSLYDGGVVNIGTGFAVPPYSTELNDYWFSTKPGDVELLKNSGGRGKPNKLANAISTAAQEISLQPFKRKMIIIIMKDISEDMEQAEGEAKKAQSVADVLVFAQNNVERFDKFGLFGKAKKLDRSTWIGASEAATEIIHLMMRKICIK